MGAYTGGYDMYYVALACFISTCLIVSGKYVGNRPIKLRKSSWRDRQFDVARKRDKERKKMGLR